jgi:hypothetical protein
MGQIEDLRNQRAAKAAEIQRNNSERQAVEAAKSAALKASAVPELLSEFGGLINVPIERNSNSSISLVLEDSECSDYLGENYMKSGGTYTVTQVKSTICAEGLEDGSVKIGDQIYPAEVARDRKKIESALEKAYKNPTVVRKANTYHPTHDKNPTF